MRKLSRILFSNLKDNRFFALILAVMVSVSLFLTVFFVSIFNTFSYDYLFLEGAELDRLYYMMNKSSLYTEGADWITQENPIVTENEAIEKIYTVTHVGIKNGVRLIIVDEELFEEFPTFKKVGIDASIMESYNDVIGLSRLSRDCRLEDVNVVGYAEAPYRFFNFNTRTNGDVPLSQIFKSSLTGYVFVGKDSDELRDKYKDNLMPEAQYIIKFKEGVTDEQKNALFKQLEVYGCSHRSFEHILQATRSTVISQVKESLPMPLFLLGVSSIAYLSALVLFFKKKEKDFSIFYVCGCSKARIVMLSTVNCTMMVLPALIINLLVFSLWDTVASRMRFQSVDLYVNGYSYLVMLLYFLLNVIIAATTTLVNMKKYSPIEFLKGVSE